MRQNIGYATMMLLNETLKRDGVATNVTGPMLVIAHRRLYRAEGRLCRCGKQCWENMEQVSQLTLFEATRPILRELPSEWRGNCCIDCEGEVDMAQKKTTGQVTDMETVTTLVRMKKQLEELGATEAEIEIVNRKIREFAPEGTEVK